MRSEGAMRVAGMGSRDSVLRTVRASLLSVAVADAVLSPGLFFDKSAVVVSSPDSSDGRPAASAEPAVTDLTKFRRLLAAGDL